MLDEEIIFQLKGDKIKTSKLTFKKNFYFLFFLFFFFISFNFFYLQIYQKPKFLKIIEKINNVSYFSFPPRGNIYDRKNKLLVSSRQSFDVYIDLNKVPDNFNLKDIFKNSNYFYRGNQVIIRNLAKEKAFELISKKLDYLRVIPAYERYYPTSSEAFGNIIGYLGFPSDNEEEKYLNEEYIGKDGVELFYQDYLRGRPGEISYQVTKNGLKKIKEEKIESGNNLLLTINANFQEKVYDLMKNYFKERNYQSGAFIALDPNSGEIISLISFPSYDPQWFFKDKNKVNQVLIDKNMPFFNRVISGLYAPGSTIKIIHALAALEEQIISPQTEIYAKGELRIPHPYLPGTYSIFRDNKIHGLTNIYKAIANSVNVYFYLVGGGYPYDDNSYPIKEGLGINRLNKYWKKFNLGVKTGIDLLNEKEGFLPSPETKRKNIFDSIWRLGDTYNVSIGQGDLLLTPLQIALFTSAVAVNKIYQPFIVKKIFDQSGKTILEKEPKLIKANLVNKDNLKIVQDAMRMTVTDGTAKNYLQHLPLAGKSGTPEIASKRKLNAIFTGYLFYNKPEIVMTLLIENVSIGSVATLPLYKQIVEAYLDLRNENNF